MESQVAVALAAPRSCRRLLGTGWGLSYPTPGSAASKMVAQTGTTP